MFLVQTMLWAILDLGNISVPCTLNNTCPYSSVFGANQTFTFIYKLAHIIKIF